MFSLLTRIGDFVSSDDMNLLRNFVRACIHLLGIIVRRRVSSGGPEEYETLCLAEGSTASISEQSCWVIISIAIGVWAQWDLWDDLEETLGRIPFQSPPPDHSSPDEPPIELAE
jgi:hypothetical protein